MSMAIPGSERFASRPVDPDTLRAALPESLKVHSVDQEAVDALDPLTYEVIRHRLWSVTEEMGEALKRMSGSPIVTDANDFDFAICDELGQEVQVGLYNTMLVGAVDLAIYWTLQHRATNPGIQEGDMFLCNDPWVGGGLHQNDVIVFQPIFHDGELFAWTSAICHEPDLGGVGLGSFSPAAQDVFSESLPTPPVKVVRDFQLQDDVADLWVRRSRVPMLVSLDLRAKVGANSVGRKRLAEVIDQYGADTVKAVMKRMMSDAESRLRGKLTGLPDGTWRATGYQDQSHEGDRSVHKITVAMTKSGDHLSFDFTGTDPQAGMINCTYAGMRGGVMLALLPMLAQDIPWSAGGLMRCFDLVSEEGTLNNAAYPAAVGRGPIGPAWLTGTLVAECLSQMLERDADLGKSVQAACCGTWDTAVLAGLDERGAVPMPFLNVMMEPMAGGYGARPHADGMDTGGLFCIPMGRVPDVEMTEFLYPLLTLWRREEPDSGGPGRQRGGVSASLAVTLHGSSHPAGLVLASAGKAVSQNAGLSGGYPGNTGLEKMARGADVHALLRQGTVPQSARGARRRRRARILLRPVLHRAGRGALHALAGRRRIRRPAPARPRGRGPRRARGQGDRRRRRRRSTAWSWRTVVSTRTPTHRGPRGRPRRTPRPLDRRDHGRRPDRDRGRPAARRQPGAQRLHGGVLALRSRAGGHLHRHRSRTRDLRGTVLRGRAAGRLRPGGVRRRAGRLPAAVLPGMLDRALLGRRPAGAPRPRQRRVPVRHRREHVLRLRSVAVLGGGPGGLYTARLLKLRMPECDVRRVRADRTRPDLRLRCRPGHPHPTEPPGRRPGVVRGHPRHRARARDVHGGRRPRGVGCPRTA